MALTPACDLLPNPHLSSISAASRGVFFAASTKASFTGIEDALATAVNVFNLSPNTLAASRATRNPCECPTR